MTKPYFPPPNPPVEEATRHDPYRSPAAMPLEPPQRPFVSQRAGARGRTCPACQTPMSPRSHGTFTTDDCMGCGGVFLDADSIQHIVSGGAETAATELLSAYPAQEVPEQRASHMYVKCPVCENIMNRTQFALGAKTIVDVCKMHGTFFDAGELPRVIDFVLHGGMQRAAEKRRQQAREQRQNELANARYEANRHPVSSFEERERETKLVVESFGDLLASLLLK